MKPKTIELLPCPFCGNARVNHDPHQSGRNSWDHVIDCDECQAIGPGGYGATAQEAREDAERSWNTRVRAPRSRVGKGERK